MTVSSILALFGAMVVLAAIPSVSVFAVTTRSATFGFLHGLFTAIGIVTGDIIFISITIGGLSLITAKMGSLFFLLKYIGAAYLIFLGVRLCRFQPQEIKSQAICSKQQHFAIAKSSLWSSFWTGLLITLADQKATLFYLGFFPAFVDMTKVSPLDTGIIIATTIFAVGGVKIIYAAIASHARLLIGERLTKYFNFLAGCIMLGVGLFLLLKP
ncbi:LysE family translocator [Brunnivagina elsteri]|uniref:Threonine transporter n=1 Tax=Brunnivagina elsteri CCALA 953 TaxID=987040 RepID=A0A2A2TE79_9CYAN|nr:LysE family translocator [Calothrix elsteri]PAX52042.1 hypothetical protein CK510_21485 [Calothrix elsteri CCALA 953]